MFYFSLTTFLQRHLLRILKYQWKSNLCDHDTSMLQSNGRTGDLVWHYHAMCIMYGTVKITIKSTANNIQNNCILPSLGILMADVMLMLQMVLKWKPATSINTHIIKYTDYETKKIKTKKYTFQHQTKAQLSLRDLVTNKGNCSYIIPTSTSTSKFN